MRPSSVAVLAIGLGVAVCSGARAEPKAALRSNASAWDGNVPFRGCEFHGDSMTLTVTDGARLIAKRDICPAYNQAKATVAIDANGAQFLVLETAEGHGTRVMRRFLEVYSLREDRNYLFRAPIGEYIGPYREWRYDYSVTKPATGGLRIVLKRRVAGERTKMDVAPPPEKIRIVTVEAAP